MALRARLPSTMLDWAVESTSAEAPRRAPPRTLKSRRREARHALVIIFLTRGTEPPRPLRDAAALSNDAVNTNSSRRFKHGRDEWQRRNGSDFFRFEKRTRRSDGQQAICPRILQSVLLHAARGQRQWSTHGSMQYLWQIQTPQARGVLYVQAAECGTSQ